MATATATKNYVSYCDALKGIVSGIDARVFFKDGVVNGDDQGWCDGTITSATLTASGGYTVVFQYDTDDVPASFVITFDSAISEGNSCDPESLAECSLMKKIDAMQAARDIAVNPPVEWGQIEGALSSQVDLIGVLNAKAGLFSPGFTGTPTVPTASTGTNTTQAASAAFTNASIAAHTAAEDCHSWDKTAGITLNAGAGITVTPVRNDSSGVITINGMAGVFSFASGESIKTITNSLANANAVVVVTPFSGLAELGTEFFAQAGAGSITVQRVRADANYSQVQAMQFIMVA